MAFACDECGYKSNEVKCGGAVSEKARKLTFKVTTTEDLARDLLKVDFKGGEREKRGRRGGEDINVIFSQRQPLWSYQRLTWSLAWALSVAASPP